MDVFDGAYHEQGETDRGKDEIPREEHRFPKRKNTDRKRDKKRPSCIEEEVIPFVFRAIYPVTIMDDKHPQDD